MKTLTILCVFFFGTLRAQPVLLDDFETLSGWRAIASEGAKLIITSGEGKTGKAMVMEFDLSGAYGYTIARKDFSMDLPKNYQFTFDMRAEAPVNNFEFKIVDSLENVWWIKKLNVNYPKQWTPQHIRRRHLTFAWGPSGGAEIRRVKAIEFVVSSGTGGKGKVYIDNFHFEPIDDSEAERARATVDASSLAKGGEPTMDEKATLLTGWKGTKDGDWLSINFHYVKEIGGLVIDWEKGRHATSYDVLLSEDGKEWTTAYTVRNGNGGRDYVYLPEQNARILKIVVNKCAGNGCSLEKLQIKGPEFSQTPNDFWSAVAKESPRGCYPRYFLNEQCFWTIIGSDADTKEALINELGTVEVDQLSFSLEPFLYINGKLITWNDVQVEQSLLDGYLPIPTVAWNYGGLRLSVRAFSAGPAGKSMLLLSYTIENHGGVPPKGKLFIALRPYQVNPPWQALNKAGGASRIDSVRRENGVLYVQDKVVIPMSEPAAFGATSFDSGDIMEYLRQGTLSAAQQAADASGFASAALEYDYDVESGNSKSFHLAVPFHSWRGSPTPNMRDGADAYVRLALDATMQFWRSKLDRVHITLPSSAQPIIHTIKSTLAYIFINRDGPMIQPGSRSYERSWIRDGSLTSTALLEMGVKDEVREFLDWYAKYQFPSGKIPCVVDQRGGDPTNEHDSHGEFIYAVMQYFHFTKDTAWLRTKFENVVKAVRFIQSLRAERKTDVYKNGTSEQRACYGLVPESISHEGYWNKPMHSYWDDFFVLRGLKDATTIAGILGEKKLEAEFTAERDDFRKDLYASMRLAMKNKNINYIPGCAELGDFDATSTTIGINPANELGNLPDGQAGIPEPELHNTFDSYYDYFVKRRDNKIEWKDYTPYENRVIGSFVYLGQKARAHEALQFFMNDRRPQAWNHWAEVVHRDPLTPKYIGDMPHTWCGSDFIRSVRAMFVYERERDNALVVGVGVPEEWLAQPDGIEVMNLPTYYGAISYSMRKAGNSVQLSVSGNVSVPAGGVVVVSPLQKKIKSSLVNGTRVKLSPAGELTIRKLPASVLIRY